MSSSDDEFKEYEYPMDPSEFRAEIIKFIKSIDNNIEKDDPNPFETMSLSNLSKWEKLFLYAHDLVSFAKKYRIEEIEKEQNRRKENNRREEQKREEQKREENRKRESKRKSEKNNNYDDIIKNRKERDFYALSPTKSNQSKIQQNQNNKQRNNNERNSMLIQPFHEYFPQLKQNNNPVSLQNSVPIQIQSNKIKQNNNPVLYTNSNRKQTQSLPQLSQNQQLNQLPQSLQQLPKNQQLQFQNNTKTLLVPIGKQGKGTLVLQGGNYN